MSKTTNFIKINCISSVKTSSILTLKKYKANIKSSYNSANQSLSFLSMPTVTLLPKRPTMHMQTSYFPCMRNITEGITAKGCICHLWPCMQSDLMTPLLFRSRDPSSTVCCTGRQIFDIPLWLKSSSVVLWHQCQTHWSCTIHNIQYETIKLSYRILLILQVGELFMSIRMILKVLVFSHSFSFLFSLKKND